LAANPGTDTKTEFGDRAHSPNGAVPDPDAEDHYSLLGVPFTATHAEITRAYRRSMKRAHPDRQRPERRAAGEAFARRLNEAYATLSNPIKRQAYDRTIRQQVIQDQIMRRYVGGFQTFDQPSGPAQRHMRREPTAAERRERIAADRLASLTLVIIAVGLTAVILVALILGAFLGSLLETIR
jgi:curved DNA-binding protein CbpA